MDDHTYSRPPSDDPSVTEPLVDTPEICEVVVKSSDVPDTLDNWMNTSLTYRVRSVAESTAKNVSSVKQKAFYLPFMFNRTLNLN